MNDNFKKSGHMNRKNFYDNRKLLVKPNSFYITNKSENVVKTEKSCNIESKFVKLVREMSNIIIQKYEENDRFYTLWAINTVSDFLLKKFRYLHEDIYSFRFSEYDDILKFRGEEAATMVFNNILDYFDERIEDDPNWEHIPY